MKKMMVSLVTLVFTLLFCGTARAQAHANRYGGGSTSHSGNTTTRTNAYGGSATHTAGQGTTASNAYGGSASHARRVWKDDCAPTPMVAARHTPPDREPRASNGIRRLCISCAKGLERRLAPTPMVVPRHITRELAPSLQLPMARQRRYIIHPLPTMVPSTHHSRVLRNKLLQLQLRLNCRCRRGGFSSRHGCRRSRSLFQ